MSLVIAKKYENSIFIFSDTKLTLSNDKLILLKRDYPEFSNSNYATVKTCIINDEVCISWAGEIIYAMEAYKSIRLVSSIEDIINLLISFNKKPKIKRIL